jgi:hypothetical protein
MEFRGYTMKIHGKSVHGKTLEYLDYLSRWKITGKCPWKERPWKKPGVFGPLVQVENNWKMSMEKASMEKAWSIWTPFPWTLVHESPWTLVHESPWTVHGSPWNLTRYPWHILDIFSWTVHGTSLEINT